MIFKKNKLFLPKSPFVEKGKTKLTFCIPHRDRHEYLQQTLRKNLDDNRFQSERIDFVLVDFGSNPGIKDWVLTEFREDIKSEYLKFYVADGLGDWHASIAKNTTHRLATGNILVNLDCDNFTGQEGGAFVINHFESVNQEIVLWQYSKKKLDGTFGRIALSSKLFHDLGGYNETLMQMGFQDGDLKDRAVAIGAKLVHERNPTYNLAIKNEKFVPKNMSWKKMNEHNERVSRKDIKEGRLVANDGKVRGLTNVKRISL